jgi:predicted esterase
VTGYGLDADRLVFLGYSNGANFLAAVIQLYPDSCADDSVSVAMTSGTGELASC